MYLPPFEYIEPGNLTEALQTLKDRGGEVRPLAGGTDLVVEMKEGRQRPQALLSLKNVLELQGIEEDEETLVIGAGTTISAVERLGVSKLNPSFGDAISGLGNLQIRNRATIGGNVCTATACADFPPVLLINDATVRIAGTKGPREVPLAGFFTGPRQTGLGDDELLVSITCRRKNPGSAYLKYGPRKAMNIAIVGVACGLELEGGTISNLKAAVTAASPTPVLVEEVTERAHGEKPGPGLWTALADIVAASLSPISDLRASAEYRLHLARTGTVRGLETATRRLRAADA